jgi:RNA polymerase sigma-70 factor (ECF subfamily)
MDQRPQDPHAGRDGSHFANTRWSLVAALRADARPQRPLLELCLRYWYPVYAYVRRCGHPPERAHRISSSFLDSFAAESPAGESVKGFGRFREFLLHELSAWIGGAGGNTDGALRPDSPFAETRAEFELRHQAEQAIRAITPELAFQRNFALEVLGRAYRRLGEEAIAARRGDMYGALEPFLTSDPPPGEYERLAGELKMAPLVVVMALKRLRGRYREIVDEELADTVSTESDFRAEREALRAALASDA